MQTYSVSQCAPQYGMCRLDAIEVCIGSGVTVSKALKRESRQEVKVDSRVEETSTRINFNYRSIFEVSG